MLHFLLHYNYLASFIYLFFYRLTFYIIPQIV